MSNIYSAIRDLVDSHDDHMEPTIKTLADATNVFDAGPRLEGRLVVGTMCHCGYPDSCFDHWELFLDPHDFDEETGEMSRAKHIGKKEMCAIVAVVEQLRKLS